MIDGPTATRVVVVPDVAPAEHDLEVVQAGNDGFAIDQTDATMRRIDSATFEVGPAIRVGFPDGERLPVLANEEALWVIEQSGSVAQQFDPEQGTRIDKPHATTIRGC